MRQHSATTLFLIFLFLVFIDIKAEESGLPKYVKDPGNLYYIRIDFCKYLFIGRAE